MATRKPASVEVADLTFRYSGAEDAALDQVSFAVAPGERLGLLGPNGAGKSTLMRLACGYLPLPRGVSGRPSKLAVGGLDVRSESLRVRQMVGYLPEQVPLYTELRVREHLEFRATIKGVRRRRRMHELGRVAEMTGLSSMLEVPIHKLSRGYRQRVGIADALLASPPLVVLDEPTVGLDPNQVQAVRAMLRDLGGNQTLVFSSHILAEVEALCDRIVILSRGRVVADEAVADALRSSVLRVEIVGDEATARRLVARARTYLDEDGQDGELRVSTADEGRTRVEVRGAPAGLADALGRAALDESVVVRRLEHARQPLEERFAEVTGAARRSA